MTGLELVTEIKRKLEYVGDNKALLADLVEEYTLYREALVDICAVLGSRPEDVPLCGAHAAYAIRIAHCALSGVDEREKIRAQLEKALKGGS